VRSQTRICKTFVSYLCRDSSGKCLLQHDNTTRQSPYHEHVFEVPRKSQCIARQSATQCNEWAGSDAATKLIGANNMSRLLSRISLATTLFLVASVASVYGQVNSYKQTNLVSDTPGLARVTDPNLINPWGISFSPGDPFWISDNNSGLSTIYDAQGNLQQPIVRIPAPHGVAAISAPTGTVFNSTPGFQVNAGGVTAPSLFLFDTEDGTISGWNGNGTNAVLAVDHSMGGAGAVYKGLAIITNGNNTFLLAANFRAPGLEVYDSNFNLTQLAGNFADPNLPAGFAPFGVHVIGTHVIVTYAMTDAARHDPMNAPGNGIVNLFDFNGNFVRRVVTGGHLNSPWGAVLGPAGFGAFSGALLIGNFGDGTVSAYDMATGNFLGQLQDGNGATIANGSLWDMVFGLGGTGDPNTLYFTAGLANEQHGLFATITPNAAQPPATADFSIGISPATATIAAGQSANINVTVGSLNGFDAATTLSCSGLPALAVCSFAPAMVTPHTGAMATSMLTISTRPAGYVPPRAVHGMGLVLWSSISGLGLLGMVLAKKRRARGAEQNGAFGRSLAVAFAVVLAMVVTLSGCGGYGSQSQTGTPAGTSTVMVTATSGALTHSSTVTLTVR